MACVRVVERPAEEGVLNIIRFLISWRWGKKPREGGYSSIGKINRVGEKVSNDKAWLEIEDLIGQNE